MSRRRRHYLLGTFVLITGALAVLLTPPGESTSRAFGRGLGYASILLLLLTLALSPWTAFRGRRIPISSMVRRDFGVWAGITGGVHALISWASSPDVALLRAAGAAGHEAAPWALLTGDRRLGIVVAVILVSLLLLSNNRAIRVLGPKTWKAFQRLAYPLVALVVAHVLGHQSLDERDLGLGLTVLGLAVAVLVCRILCRWRHTTAAHRRVPAPYLSPTRGRAPRSNGAVSL